MSSTASFAPTLAEAALHPGHVDPVSGDPLVSVLVRLALAMLAGLVAGGLTWIPVRRLWHGDVVPVLLVSSVTGDSIVEVENWKAWTALTLVGGLVATLGMGIGLLAFDTTYGLGLETLVFVAGYHPLSVRTLLVDLGATVLTGVPAGPLAVALVQTLVAGGLAAGVLFLASAYLLLPRFGDEVASLSAVRKHWAICAATYAVAFVLVRIATFVVLYG